MADDASPDVFTLASEAWERAMVRGFYHEAINIGISAYLFCRAEKDIRWADGALNLVHVAITMLRENEGSHPATPGTAGGV